MRVSRWLTFVVAAIIVAACAANAARETQTDTEKKLGKEGAAEAEKSLKFVKDEGYVKRVEKIGQELAATARTTKVPAAYGNADLADFTYTFRVVDDKEINAFSLPAGYVYVNKGLIDDVDSDDELAGVLAHEIAHVAHHHMMKLLHKQAQLDGTVFLLIAAAVIGKVQGSDMQNIFYGAKLVEIAKLNAYSQEAEDDADNTAIEYVLKTKHNPVGVLTFMEKLAQKEAFDPDPGILRTHPPAAKRAESIRAALEKQGVPINRWGVTSGMEASARDTAIGNKKVWEVVIGDRVIFQAADTSGATSAERAGAAAERINHQLEQNPQQWEVRVGNDGSAVYVRQQLVVDVLQADADLVGASREAVAIRAKESIQAALTSSQLRFVY